MSTLGFFLKKKIYNSNNCERDLNYKYFYRKQYKVLVELKGPWHSCQYRTICNTYRIVFKKFRIVRVYNIVLVNRTYHMIHRHVSLKWVFLLKFVILFDLNKLLDFVNTKLLGNLIKSNKITSPWVFPPFSFSYKI